MKKTIPKSANLIPHQAKKVFHGRIFDVYQWQQKMFDGSIETFEMLKRTDACNILAVKDGKLVMVKQIQPHWTQERLTFPGGRADDGEDSLSMAKRELLEEAGMKFKNWRLIDCVQVHEKMEYFIYAYLATELREETATNHDSGEKMETILMNFDEVRKLAVKEPRLRTILDFNSMGELLSAPKFEGQEIDI